MRISEVEIMSMFTPAFDRASKKVNETPRVSLHARANQRQLTNRLVVNNLLETQLSLSILQRLSAVGALSLIQG